MHPEKFLLYDMKIAFIIKANAPETQCIRKIFFSTI